MRTPTPELSDLLSRSSRALRALAVALLIVGLVASPATAARKVVIKGGGWGHGIGMSQYGAYGRAKQGVGATKILTHYYRQTNVKEVAVPKKIRVGLMQDRSVIHFTSSAMGSGNGRVSWRETTTNAEIAQGDSTDSWRVEPSSTGGMRLYKNGNQIERNGVGVWGTPETPLELRYEEHSSLAKVTEKNTAYAYGRLKVATYQRTGCGAGYCLRLVLALPMQKYIYGLGEVPASWPNAVLKAQAIAGRTYAMDKINRSGQHRYPCDCAVYDSVLDQAYIGDSKRTGSGQYWDDWKSAVDATDRKVVLHNKTPIQALYSSTSGGHTEHNENVWGGTPLPYLRGVPDAPDKESPYHNWTVEMSWNDFENKLQSAFGIGNLKRVRLIKPFGVSGRVTVVRDNGGGGVKVVGSQKTARVSGWSMRSALSLRDTLFRIKIVYTVSQQFSSKYTQLDGAPGYATSNAYQVPRGATTLLGLAQNFEIGRMTYNGGKDKVVWQSGSVLDRYDELGREASPLGMPTSGIWGPGEYLGGTYENGMIVWSTDTGARAIVGAYLKGYRRAGGVKGELGLPTSGRKKVDTLPKGGRQAFQNGTLYKLPSGEGVFALWGPIDARYREIGEASSPCGYPTGSMIVDADGARAEFQHGMMSFTAAGGVTVSC